MSLSLRAPGGRFDLEEARRALQVLCEPTLAHELRGLPTGASVILPGSDVEGLSLAAEALSRNNNSVYLCLNPVALDCQPEKAVKDIHVVQRKHLLIDIDPVKPEQFKDSPATDQEKDAVLRLAGEVDDFLTSLGWPEPVAVDSGNGCYLIYWVDLPNDKPTRELVKSFLWRLSARFSGSGGKIDRATHNAARIAKLPGAWSKKVNAIESPGRPFRTARLLHVPTTLVCVSEEQIGTALQEETETLADVPDVPDASFDFGANAPPEKNGAHAGLKAKAPGRTSDYGRAALDSAAAHIRAATPGGTGGIGRNDTLFREAAAIAELVAGGEIDAAEAIAALEAIAAEVGLDAREIASTINSAIQTGSQKPRTAPEKDAKRRDKEKPPGKWRITLDGDLLHDGDLAEMDDYASTDSFARCVEMLTLGGMLATEFPEPNWAVPGIMSEGLNILAGAPKKGKSILSLNLALTLAGGGKVMGSVKVLPSDVLYLSLEDKSRRIKSRALKMLQKIQPDHAESVKRRLTLATSWPKLDEGGLPAINLWRERAENPGLVIIDTWARFCPAFKPSGSAYQQDADAMAAIQRYVNRHGFTALVVHHTRKTSINGEPEDYVQEVSGTLGLSGVCDGILVLMRIKGEEGRATLHVTGRDVGDQDLVLEFDATALVWTNLGTRAQHVEGRVQQKVVEYLRSVGRAEFCKDIAVAISEGEASVRLALNRLKQSNIVRKVGNAWAFPGEFDEEVIE